MNDLMCHHYCHSPDIFSSSSRCCTCSIPMEEILTWIIIGSLTLLLYNTIKLCLMICFTLFILYLICTRTDIPRLLYEFFQNQFDSKSLPDEEKSIVEDNNNIEDNQELAENDNDQKSLSIKTSSNSNVNISATSNNHFSQANNCDELIIRTVEKVRKNQNEKKPSHQSTTKKRLKNTDDQEIFSSYNSIAQPGYYGPIHTIASNTIHRASDTSETLTVSNQDSHKSTVQSQTFVHLSNTSVVPDKHSIDNIIQQTQDIRHMIKALHEDILHLKTNSNTKTIGNLSSEEQSVLKQATENLIRAIMSTRTGNKVNMSSEEKFDFTTDKRQEVSPLIFDDNDQQSKKMNSTHSDLAVTSNEIDNSVSEQFQHPKCITVQTSFAINSSMPRVPTRSTINNEEEDEEKSLDDYIKIPQHSITTNEYFENLPPKDEQQRSKNSLFLKQDSINVQPDWPYYSSKPDLFPNINQSNLPVIQSKGQHSSFKQTFLSHFHHRPKFTSTNHSSINDLTSTSSHSQKTMTPNLKQRIFRVRKSRIIISVDDIHPYKDIVVHDKNNSNRLIDTTIHDISTEINDTCSINEQQNKISNSSIVSLFRSFDSTIQEGELFIYDDKLFYQDKNENEDSLSEMSNSLYSVTSQLILI